MVNNEINKEINKNIFILDKVFSKFVKASCVALFSKLIVTESDFQTFQVQQSLNFRKISFT